MPQIVYCDMDKLATDHFESITSLNYTTISTLYKILCLTKEKFYLKSFILSLKYTSSIVIQYLSTSLNIAQYLSMQCNINLLTLL